MNTGPEVHMLCQVGDHVVDLETDAVQRLGPRPATPGAAVELGDTRAAVLAMLDAAPASVTISEVAKAIGAHGNSARNHLDGLTADGLVTREPHQTGRRGRPRFEYTITDAGRAAHLSQGQPDALGLEYHGLLSAFAAHIDGYRSRPGPVAQQIGQAWGQTLARSGRGAARQQILDLLTRLGFSPVEPSGEPGGDRESPEPLIELRTCPLLDLALAHPEVICSVHLGLVQGALRAAGGDPEAVELAPFAAVGACHLRLPAHPPGRGLAPVPPQASGDGVCDAHGGQTHTASTGLT